MVKIFLASLLIAGCASQVNYYKEFEDRDAKIRVLKHQVDSLKAYINSPFH